MKAKVFNLAQCERDERIINYIEAGTSTKAIAITEGMDPDQCRKHCRALIKEHQLKVPEGPRDTTPPGLPIGVTDGSRGFRARLGDKLYYLINDMHGHRLRQLEVAMMSGVPASQQSRASARPFAHDWTLGQIERLRVALEEEEDFTLFMARMIFAPDGNRPPERKKQLVDLLFTPAEAATIGKAMGWKPNI